MTDPEILAWLIEHREWMGQPVREGYNAIIDALRARCNGSDKVAEVTNAEHGRAD